MKKKYRCPKCGLVVLLDEKKLDFCTIEGHFFCLAGDTVKVLCPEQFGSRR